MKVWIIVIRASDDEAADGVTDELCSGQVFKRLDRAKKECSKILEDDYGQDNNQTDFTDEIEWMMAVGPRWVGRPKADVDETFELHQAEVV